MRMVGSIVLRCWVGKLGRLLWLKEWSCEFLELLLWENWNVVWCVFCWIVMIDDEIVVFDLDYDKVEGVGDLYS